MMRERMRALTFEVICRAVFGVTEPARVERLREALLAVIDLTRDLHCAEWMRTDFGRSVPGGMFTPRMRAADALLYEEIALRRREPDLEQRTDVLSLLLRARDEDGEPMTDVELRDELMTMLAAGHETTATGLRSPSTCCSTTRRRSNGCAKSWPATTTPTSTPSSPRRCGCGR